MPVKTRKTKNPSSHQPRINRPTILTPRQVQILRMIQDYRTTHGCSPTLQEMAESLKLSKVTVFEHVESLVKKGTLKREANKARSLMIADSISLAGDKSSSSRGGKKRNSTDRTEKGSYPLAGAIAAGQPIESFDTSDTIDLTSLFETREGTYALAVKGNSMIDDHICDGDIVLIKPTRQPHNGDVVVAVLNNGEATLKRFYQEKDRIRLQPANAEFAPIYTRRVDIQGTVVGVLRRFQG